MLVLAFSTAMAEEAAVNVGGKLQVEIKIGTGLEQHEPTGVADSFPVSVSQLVGWTRVTGAESPVVIKHAWLFNGEEKAEIELGVKSSTFRTWSRKNIYGLTGKWKLEVKGPDGTVLASKEIEVTPEPQTPPEPSKPAETGTQQ